jgi:hypothetical protein
VVARAAKLRIPDIGQPVQKSGILKTLMFWLVTLGETKTNQIEKTFPRWTFRYNNHAFVKSKQVKANNLVRAFSV